MFFRSLCVLKWWQIIQIFFLKWYKRIVGFKFYPIYNPDGDFHYVSVTTWIVWVPWDQNIIRYSNLVWHSDNFDFRVVNKGIAWSFYCHYSWAFYFLLIFLSGTNWTKLCNSHFFPLLCYFQLHSYLEFPKVLTYVYLWSRLERSLYFVNL